MLYFSLIVLNSARMLQPTINKKKLLVVLVHYCGLSSLCSIFLQH